MSNAGKGDDARPFNIPGRSIPKQEFDKKFDKLDWSNYKNNKNNKQFDDAIDRVLSHILENNND